jgi:hypothetical protein
MKLNHRLRGLNHSCDMARVNKYRCTESNNKMFPMEYFFQQLIRWKFKIVVAYVSQVSKFKEHFHRLYSFSKLEGFQLLHKSNIVQTGTKTGLTCHTCTSASKVELRWTFTQS